MHGIPVRSGMLAASAGLVLSLVVPLGVAMADTPTDVPPADATPVSDPAPTLTALPTATPTPTPTAVVRTAPQPRVLRQGMRGTDVLRWEKRLLVPRADRVFDRFTRQRVQQVQKWAHIPRTGRIDARTRDAISAWNRDQVVKRSAAKRTLNTRLARIIAVARQYKGRPYARGAAGPGAFDCSGYTRFVVRKAIGRSLPHQSGSQAASVKRISRSQARPGDLVFFRSGGRVYHVAIYAGGNRVWHASRPGTRSGLGPIFSSSISFGRVA